MTGSDTRRGTSSRLDRLERQCRLLRAAVLLVLLVLGAATLTGFSPSGRQVVEAEQFVARDAAGVVRASMGVTAGVPAITLHDQSGAIRVGLKLDSSGNPSLSLLDGAGETKGAILVDEAGNGSAHVLGSKGKEGVLLFAHSRGGAMTLSDPQGRKRIVLGATNDGSASIFIADQHGELVWYAPEE